MHLGVIPCIYNELCYPELPRVNLFWKLWSWTKHLLVKKFLYYLFRYQKPFRYLIHGNFRQDLLPQVNLALYYLKRFHVRLCFHLVFYHLDKIYHCFCQSHLILKHICLLMDKQNANPQTNIQSYFGRRFEVKRLTICHHLFTLFSVCKFWSIVNE